MIQLDRPVLSIKATNKLNVYQTIIDIQPGFPAQVTMAKTDFPKKNVIGNKTFDEVKLGLIQMSSGAERCHYCEDSKADEVEHFLPKDVYPDQCYSWSNYFYSCGSCNGKKDNNCAVIDTQNGQLINTTPPKKNKTNPLSPLPTPPPPGIQAFINPETEDPLIFFLLDLQNGSFEFAELPDINSIDYKRAKYTLQTLRLNKRAFLRKARQQAYGDFKARLTEYIHHRNQIAPISQINKMIEEIKTHSHPTVWKEMVRQRFLIPQLQNLFNQAPEAINW